MQKAAVGIVGGSNLVKIEEQMGPTSANHISAHSATLHRIAGSIACKQAGNLQCTLQHVVQTYYALRAGCCTLLHCPFDAPIPASVAAVKEAMDFTFAENGLVAYKGTELLATQSLKTHMGEDKLKAFLNFVLHYIADLDIPIKRGTFIEFRAGMLNISPIGRNCSQAERDDFEQFDQQAHVRCAPLGRASLQHVHSRPAYMDLACSSSHAAAACQRKHLLAPECILRCVQVHHDSSAQRAVPGHRHDVLDRRADQL